MNIVPLICIKKGKLFYGKEKNKITIESLFKKMRKDAMIYVLDLDGIERNNPALELYQRLTEKCVIWIDNGPRRLDDVMDTIMAGATKITFREELWPEIDFPSVFEITDDEIYIGIQSTDNQISIIQAFSNHNIGIVVLHPELQIDDDFISRSILKNLALKHQIYIYIGVQKNHEYWDERGVTGILIDLNKEEGYQHGF